VPTGRVHHQRRSAPRLDRLPDGSGAGQYRPARAGRPRSRPGWVLADKAYSSKAHRDYLAGRGIKAAIPIKDDQAAALRKKGPRGGRPPSFDRERYRVRHTVERAINKLRNHRATATRYEKRDFIYRGQPSPSPASGFGSTTPPNPITEHALWRARRQLLASPLARYDTVFWRRVHWDQLRRPRAVAAAAGGCPRSRQ
jgi:hypothetical protein